MWRHMLLDRIPVRLRLSLGHSIVLAGLLALLGFGIFKYVQQNLYESLDAALRSSAYGIRDSRYVKGWLTANAGVPRRVLG